MKKRRSTKAAFLPLLVIVIFFLSCCASSPSVIGRWKEIGKAATIEFSKDGTFKAVDNQGMAVSGKYILSEDGHLRCEIVQEGKIVDIVNLTVSIKGDELTLSSPKTKGFESYRRER